MARPAGWFLSAPGEAAPPGAPGTEPARPDTARADGDEADLDEADLDEADLDEADLDEADLDEADLQTAPGDDHAGREALADPGDEVDPAEAEDLDDAAAPETMDEPCGHEWQQPVVGPTQALRGRAGGPGFRVPAGLGFGVRDPEGRSGWQVAHGLWQDSGIGWDGPPGTPPGTPPAGIQPPAALPAADAGTLLGAPTAQDALPRPAAEDALPRRVARPVRPTAPDDRDLPDQDAQPQLAELAQPPAWTPPTHARGESRAHESRAHAGQRDGGPGRAPYRQQSPQWQAPERHSDEREAYAEDPYAEDPYQEQQPQRRPWEAPQLPRSPQGRYRANVLDEPRGRDRARAWDEPGSRETLGGKPPAGPARPRRRGRAWQVARVAVPVALVITVGAGALMLLTGKTHEILSPAGSHSRGSAGAPPGAPGGAGSNASTSSGQAAAIFPGYPGQQGSESVNSIASGNGTQIAAGSADGHAAIWRRAGSGGAWTLLSDSVVSGQPTGTVLTSIVHGPAGWLAVGDVDPVAFGGAGTAHAPVVLASADGMSWHSVVGYAAAFNGPGFQVNSAASHGHRYVVVGSQYRHGQPVDAMWSSPDLVSWTRGQDTIATTTSSVSSGMSDSEIFAAAAVPGGFVAVGTHNGCHTAWVTSDGRHWLSYDIPKPTGSKEPLLSHVAVAGNVVVAAGDLGVKGSRIPLVVVSDDGGLHWKMTPIGGYSAFAGPQGTVTALASDGSGFLAAGLIGPQGSEHAVTWTSPDGVTWSQAMPASNGTQAITVLTSAGGTVAQVATVTAKYGTRSVEAPASNAR